ncbi:MAG: metalloprotease TldD, partial [Zoogloeaceae bacterium]|nr:metalloprotease TldD [Zoogloeaceae bacterium]
MSSPLPSFSPLAQAERLLLTPYALGLADLESVFGRVMGARVDYADLYFQYSRYESWSLDEGIVKAGSFNIDQGVGVRALSGEKTAFAYSDDIRLSALQDAADSVRAIGAMGQDAGATGQIAAPHTTRLAPLPLPASLYREADPLASLPAVEKVRLLERLEAFARAADPRVAQVMASLAGEWEVVLIAGSDGRLAADVRPLARVSISVIIEDGGRREQGAAGGGGRFDYGYFSDAVLREYARQATHQAAINLDARPAPAGQTTVVLGPGWPGILLHEAVGHGLEGDFNRKGSSAFAG